MHEQERQKRPCFVVLSTNALVIRDKICYSDHIKPKG